MILLLLAVLLFPQLAHAQSLLFAQTTPPRLEWSYQPAASSCTAPTPAVDVQSSATFGGTYTRVAQLPITATTYALPTTANNLFYLVSTPCGNSNVVQYVAVTSTGPTIDERVTTIETSVAALRLADQALALRLTALEAPAPPAPTSNFTITHIDATHIRIVCNGIGITTLGSGTSRTMECRQ